MHDHDAAQPHAHAQTHAQNEGAHDHDHDHDHGHHHAHGDSHNGHHHHAPASFGAAFAIGTLLNAGFVVAEVGAGLSAHSMALIGDAGHNLGDVLGLVLAWVASILARRGPTHRYTYGYGRGTILAALINASLLLVSVGAIAVEAVRRLIHPEVTHPLTIGLVAAIGIAINGVTALLFAAGRRGEANLRAAFAHMAGDAVISAGVVLAAVVLAFTGWQRIDPAVSLLLAGLIAWSTRDLFAESLTLSFDAVPDTIDAAAVRTYLAALPGVLRLHDLHIWPMSTSRAALTCHLVTAAAPDDGFVSRACVALHERFGIDHSTLQLEREGDPCALEPDHVI
jgi:cobalt-zinc-cadmium efflux system protein